MSRTLTFTVSFMAMCLHVTGQESLDAFAALPANEIAGALSSNRFGAYTFKDLANAAIVSHRMDLIRECFLNPKTARAVFDAADQLPASEFKNQVLVMMLRENKDFWGPDTGVLYVGNQRDLTDAVRVYRPLIASLLKDTNSIESRLETYAARSATAASIEAALTVIHSGASVKSPDATPPPQTEPNVKSPAIVQPPLTAKAPEAKPSTSSEEPTSSTPWSVVAVLIVAVTGLLWLLLKRRS